MPILSALLHPPRARKLLAAAVGVALVVIVVLANRPGIPPTTAAAGRPAASGAATSTTSHADAAAATVEQSGLHVLSGHLAFRDESGLHGDPPALTAAAGILIDPDRRSILWESDPHTPRAPASTAKILTSLVALANFAPDRRVDVTADALGQAGDESHLGMQAGDHYTITELIQAMMLLSANDAATAIATDTVGMRRFVLAMNEQVAALGLRDSHFVNPVGLDDPGEQTSPYDLAVLGLTAYDAFPQLREIVGSTDIDVPATDGHIAYHLRNLDRLLQVYPGAARGIKPGYTGAAGYCLVMLAERDGHRLLGVLMDDPHLYVQSRTLLEWGFGVEGLAPIATPTPPTSLHP